MKLAGIFIGAPLALAAQPLEAPWLFWLGFALLVAALVLPSRPGQTIGERLRSALRHLPVIGWIGKRDD